jgi:hypothetical protein
VRLSSIAVVTLAVPAFLFTKSGIGSLRQVSEGGYSSLFLIQTLPQKDRSLEEYQTRGTTLDVQEVGKWANAGYWEQKLGQVFLLSVDPRLGADAEERDAVLSAIWSIRPKVIKKQTKAIVVIPKRTARQSKAIAYAVTFIEKTGSQPKDTVEARFLTEGQGATAIVAPALTGGLWPRQFSFSGFPNNDIGRYWADNPEERDRIANWINFQASARFDQILATELRQRSGHPSTLFHVIGRKDAVDGATDLMIEFLGPGPALTFDPPQDYALRDFADLQIERAQQEPDIQKHDRLGAVNGLEALPASERLSVKFAIWQYFKSGTHNAEVHAIIPIAKTGRRVLCILRFLSNNDVIVERIGEEGTELSLIPLGDLNRLHDFGDTSMEAPELKTRLARRYPAIVTAGVTADAVKSSFAREMDAKSGSPAWFKENYGIEILGADEARSRLRSTFQFNPQQLAKLKEFTSFELKSLELALGGMSDKFLAALKGLQIARQETSAVAGGLVHPAQAGLTVSRGADHLILIFDRANASNDALFLGGRGQGQTPRVAVATIMTFAHEIGHVISEQPGVRAAFEKLVSSKNIKPVTWYAASNPKTEFFPEVFALYHCDPEWLGGSRPDIFAWFRLLSAEGLPPVK